MEKGDDGPDTEDLKDEAIEVDPKALYREHEEFSKRPPVELHFDVGQGVCFPFHACHTLKLFNLNSTCSITRKVVAVLVSEPFT